MKTQLFLLLIFFVASESMAQSDNDDKNDNAFSRVYHYRNTVSVSNFDGTRSTINVNYNSATLVNPDGTMSTINFNGQSSTLIEIDGTMSSISHNGLSSQVTKADGSQILITHQKVSSSCTIEGEKHIITHNFGLIEEMRNKNGIDVLIHMNWLSQKGALQAVAQAD